MYYALNILCLYHIKLNPLTRRARVKWRRTELEIYSWDNWVEFNLKLNQAEPRTSYLEIGSWDNKPCSNSSPRSRANQALGSLIALLKKNCVMMGILVRLSWALRTQGASFSNPDSSTYPSQNKPSYLPSEYFKELMLRSPIWELFTASANNCMVHYMNQV